MTLRTSSQADRKTTMLFNSYQFLVVYLPLTLLGYFLASKISRGAVVGWLAIASICFYGYWRPEFLIFLGASILVNFLCIRLIAGTPNEQKRKRILWTGVAANLLALGYYKYLFALLLGFHNLGFTDRRPTDILLPLGISFFTFTQIGYLIDLAQGEAEPQGFTRFVLFVTFFPHLIAGPVLHHSEIMPQFSEDRRYGLNFTDVAVGFSWFVMGLFKKIVIADAIAPAADAAYANPGALSFLHAWLALLSYAMQLYFDFSAYSDMALGLARMFSIEFPLNFNSPYKSRNIVDFWSRWHMTLTRYLTLYLYNPISLAVSRHRAAAGKKLSRKAIATPEGFLTMLALPTFVTMLLAGVWHGAGLQFLIFGLLHSVYLVVFHAWNLFRPKNRGSERPSALRRHAVTVASVGLTFLCVLGAQIFFRASSTHSAFAMLGSLAGAHGLGLAAGGARENAHLFLQLLPAFFIVWFLPNTQQILGKYAHRDLKTGAETETSTTPSPAWKWKPTLLWAAALGLVLVFCLIRMQDPSKFLYFQF